MVSQLKFPLISKISKVFAYLMVSSILLYLLNNYLVYWQELPGPYQLLVDPGLSSNSLTEESVNHGWILLAGYLLLLLSVCIYAIKNKFNLIAESLRFEQLAAFLIRAAFLSVLLIGLTDALISFLRIEGLLDFWVGEKILTELGRPIFRGSYIHYPLIIGSCVVALFIRNISFSWLALLVVLAEFLIVITRFVFSYEQAFMGDLVRFWYAALFLFASAYTLVHEGHVRVDVLYSTFSSRKKAYSNVAGSLFLGMPLCWVILMQGMGGRGNSINSALLSFEISQSGYGMYVKYLMVGFLVVFSLTMLIQFVSFMLKNMALLVGEDDAQIHATEVISESLPEHEGSLS